MPTNQSISQWIASLKAGEMMAAERLWNRFKTDLSKLAERQLAKVPKGIADEEDIAQSVFLSLWRGATAGRFENIKNRDELWWLLLAITKQKAVNLIRRETAKKRGGGHVVTEMGLRSRGMSCENPSLDQLIGDTPSPEWIAILGEQNQRLMGLLGDDSLRKIAVSRIEGYTVGEIAADLAVSTRSVERKLQLIRKKWSQELVCAEFRSDST